MTTDELISALSRGAGRGSRFGATAAVVLIAVGATIVALGLSMMWLRPRSDLNASLLAENHVFLLKLAFTISVVAAALPIVRDLSIPGRRIGLWALVAAAPFAMIVALALHELAGLPVHEWSHHVGDTSGLACLWEIPALAFPAFVMLVLGIRHLAPTNLARTGAYIGLAAGGIGAVGYAFHCHDDSIAFVAASYTFAILEMTLLGAVLGPRMLRWTAGSQPTKIRP